MRFEAAWDEIIGRLPHPHFLQTAEWADVKSRFGWHPQFWIWTRGEGAIELHEWGGQTREDIERSGRSIAAAALVLIRRPPVPARLLKRSVPLGIAYAPKGPLLDWDDRVLRLRVLSDLQDQAKNHGAAVLKIDPDVELGRGIPGTETARENLDGLTLKDELSQAGWFFSPEQIQFRNTILVDLSPEEDEMLSRMKQKTRYNIRLAGRRGVAIRSGGAADYPLLYDLYAETGRRDGFTIRSQTYYDTVWRTFAADRPVKLQPQTPQNAENPGGTVPSRTNSYWPVAEPLIAAAGEDAAAAAVIFRFAERAWFVYGMSRSAHRDKMPGYLLQWEAMRRAKASGCEVYDFWGAPDHFEKSDRLWGVYRFKQGFQGEVVRHLGAWDYVLRPGWYRIYRFMTSVRRKLQENPGER